MKVLLVEDDEGLVELVTTTLNQRQNFIVDAAFDGYEGLELAETFEYDLILLDILLPELNGIEVCQTLRQKGDRTPILLLTAQDEVTKKVKGLDAGADDYLVKPFAVPELLARIRALLRRQHDSFLSTIEWEDLILDPNNCQVNYRENLVKLTAKEYSLLELFLRHPQRIFSQTALLDRLWASTEMPSENAVRTQIKGLRSKIKQAGMELDLIETVYGLGYRLKQKQVQENDRQKQSQEETLEEEAADSDRLATNSDEPELFKLDLIWQKHQSKYLNLIKLLKQALQAIENNAIEPKLRQQAIQAAHTLAGSLGSFGFTEAAAKSREIEQILETECILSGDLASFSQLLLDLEQELNYSDEAAVYPVSIVPPYSYLPSSLSQQYQLLIIDDDEALVEILASEAKSWGSIATVAYSLAQAREILAHTIPDAVLLDLTFPDATEGGFELLKELAEVQPPIPVIVITAKESFADRLKVVRLGGKGFLQKPVSTSQVMETISQVLQQTRPSNAKILVVDDNRQTLDYIYSLLNPWGFIISLVATPQHFWDILEQSNPDLLVLNVEMQHLSGIELCQVVRNDPRWYQLPILFVSSCSDEQTKQLAFNVGADDYLNLPIVPEELLTRILNRLEKERYRRQLAETDPLTGITNRRTSIQQLGRMLNLAKRQQKKWCFVILDLDNFKQINDDYGHDAGDRVLHSLGKLLKQVFRSEDVIARWGGEEFILGLYDMTKESSKNRLSDLLDTFYRQKFSSHQQQTFSVSFSAGIAEYPLDGTDLDTLYQVADTALYQAKSAGRKRVY